MICFPDTSFLCALYRTQVNSSLADRYMYKLRGSLAVSSLLLLEFRQSVRLQTRLHLNDKTKGFTQEEGQHMLNDIQIDLTGFDVGDSIHISHVKLPTGSESKITDRDFTIATIVAPSALKSSDGDTTVTEGEAEA